VHCWCVFVRAVVVEFVVLSSSGPVTSHPCCTTLNRATLIMADKTGKHCSAPLHFPPFCPLLPARTPTSCCTTSCDALVQQCDVNIKTHSLHSFQPFKPAALGATSVGVVLFLIRVHIVCGLLSTLAHESRRTRSPMRESRASPLMADYIDVSY